MSDDGKQESLPAEASPYDQEEMLQSTNQGIKGRRESSTSTSITREEQLQIPRAQNVNSGPGTQFNHIQGGSHNTQHNTQQFFANQSDQDRYRSCIHRFRFPDPFKVKSWLLETKDKLLSKAIAWINEEEAFIALLHGTEICLLWIKGGAGKGKTMLSIGLVEQLARLEHAPLVLYFFCRNSDHELNTAESIVKGLIRCLADQEPSYQSALQSLWDDGTNVARQDVFSLDELWMLFLSMIERTRPRNVFILIDALDECEADGLSKLLMKIMRTGLNDPSRVKWILTSRPSDLAEAQLLTSEHGHAYEQRSISLELKSAHVASAVQIYIAHKLAELGKKHYYEQKLREALFQELLVKAEGTFLWVNLVCHKLEETEPEAALAVIQETPTSLDGLYAETLSSLVNGPRKVVARCVRLLQAMLLVFRPLHLAEIESVAGEPPNTTSGFDVMARCASFIRLQGTAIEFVHQSARDYLAAEDKHSLLSSYSNFGHVDIAKHATDFLKRHLKVDLLDLRHPVSTWDQIDAERFPDKQEILTPLGYAASFWLEHLASASKIELLNALELASNLVKSFLQERALEWLECLSLSGDLIQALSGSEGLLNSIKESNVPVDADTRLLVEDLNIFIRCNDAVIKVKPLQIYSYAILFTPAVSLTRQNNMDKLPSWLVKHTVIDTPYARVPESLRNMHIIPTSAVFSPDGQTLAGVDEKGECHIFSAHTGERLRSYLISCVPWRPWTPDGSRCEGEISLNSFWWQKDHESIRCKLLYSPDGGILAIVSVYFENIRLVTADTRQELCILYVEDFHSLDAVAFLPDSKSLATGGSGSSVYIWDVDSGECLRTIDSDLGGHTCSVVCQRKGTLLGIGHQDGIELKCAVTEEPILCLSTNSKKPKIVFSPDDTAIAVLDGGKIGVWDCYQGNLIGAAQVDESFVCIAFSTDGKHIFGGSTTGRLTAWAMGSTDLQHVCEVNNEIGIMHLAVSPDGISLAVYSAERTIRIWEIGLLCSVEAGTPGSHDHVRHIRPRELNSMHDRQAKVHQMCDAMQAVCLSPDSELALLACETHIHICNVDERVESHRIECQSRASGFIESMALSHDRNLLAVVCQRLFSSVGGRLLLYNVSRVQRAAVWSTKNRIVDVLFSPDDRILAIISENQVDLLNVATHLPFRNRIVLDYRAKAAAFSSDGISLAVLCRDDHTGGYVDLVHIKSYHTRRLNLRTKMPLTKTFYLRYADDHRIYLGENIRFSRKDRLLSTSVGSVSLDSSKTSMTYTTDAEAEFCLACHIHRDHRGFWDAWIGYKGDHFLHLPLVNDSGCCRSQGNHIILGCTSGVTYVLTVDRAALIRDMARWQEGWLLPKPPEPPEFLVDKWPETDSSILDASMTDRSVRASDESDRDYSRQDIVLE